MHGHRRLARAIKYLSWFTPVLAATLLLVGVRLGLADGSASPVGVAKYPGTRFVATGGADANDCSSPATACRTVQRAVDVAVDGDTIKVAAGVYTDGDTADVGYVVALTKTVILRGGYEAAFAGPPDPLVNPTVLNAQRLGRVVYIVGYISPIIEGLRVTGGNAARLGGNPCGLDAGGGVYAISATVTLRGGQVYNNTAYVGGGVYLLHNDGVVLRRNTIAANSADFGGGVYLRSSAATLSGNTVTGNAADQDGGGLYLLHSDGATLSENTVTTNTAGHNGGGVVLWFSDATLSGNTIATNSAKFGAGVFLWDSDNAMLNGNGIVNNDAAKYGGGIFLWDSDPTLTNNVIADNQAHAGGSGLNVMRSSPCLLHTTVAHNTGGDGSGIHVTTDSPAYHSSVALTNTIIVGHGVGITVTANNAAALEATLWGSGGWANDTDWGGEGTVDSGVHNHWGDPAFVDPDAGGYHIDSGSAAIDRGVYAGVTTDIDGEARPRGCFVDIGADESIVHLEYERTYLPLVIRDF